MTEEQGTKDTGVATDAVVTKAYRETADEQAPDSLNRAILDQAAKASRPRYSRFIQWTRPMAWAATVMLSVAIVLQLTQVPEVADFEDIIPEVEAPADTAVLRLEEAVLPAAGSGRASNEVTNAAPKIEALRSSAKQVAPSAVSEARQRSEQSKADVANQELAAPEFDSGFDELKLKDQDMLQRANDMARMQDGANQEAPPASESAQFTSADAPALGLVNSSVESPGCDESVTATAETWLQCIADLEAAGRGDIAREQRELFTAAFPDFDTP